MLRILAHYIVHDGKRHHLSVVQFADDFSEVEILPFAGETAATIFVEGEITLKKSSGKYFAEKNGQKLVF